MATLLILTVFLPLVGSLALAFWPSLDYRPARWVALGFVLATLALTLVLVANFRSGVAGPQFTTGSAASGYGVAWMERPNIRFALGLDGLSFWLFALTTVLMVTSIFSSWESVRERPAAHYALMLALHSALLGLFASLDIILFYVFFEFMLIPMFFLIGLWGGSERRRASVTFFLYTLAGSLLTLLGVIALVIIHQQFAPSHTLTFSIPELTDGLKEITANEWPDWFRTEPWSTSPQVLIFLLLFAGFAIKVPLFPFHTWLPLAHVEAPTAGSVLLAGILLKVGGYGFLRFNLGMAPLGAQACYPLLATISVIGVIYGALTALAQTDIKRLVAYSSVSHMGLIALGMFSLNAMGMDGAVLQMVNHGLTTGALFACVGVLYERYHTRQMNELGGLWKRLPLLAFFLILSSMGSIALPGLNGFAGEFPILVGAFHRSQWSAILGATGMILGAYYLLWMVQRVLFGPLHEPDPHAHHDPEQEGAELAATPAAHEPVAIRPVGWHEIAGLTPLMVLIVAIGVYPRYFFDRIVPTVEVIAQNYRDDVPATRPAFVRTGAPESGPRPRTRPGPAAGRRPALVSAQEPRP